MPTREEIFETLARSQEHLFNYYRGMTLAELERQCTESEVPGGHPWRPKDHVSPLAFIERQFLAMARRTIEGKRDPIGIKARVGTTNSEEVLAWVHRQNQAYADEHANDSLGVILADLTATRQESLDLVARVTDKQLALRIPGAPWNDGTIGGVMITNAHHAEMHTSWVEKGLAEPV